MATRNFRQVLSSRQQGNNSKVTNIKDGPTTRGLSGLSIRPTIGNGRGRAPLAEISTNQQNTNNQSQAPSTFNVKSGVPFQVFQDDAENKTFEFKGKGPTATSKHCMRTYNQQARQGVASSTANMQTQPLRANRSSTNQTQRGPEDYPDENLAPPRKMANIETSSTHPMWDSNNDPWSTKNIATSTSTSISISSRPSFVIHQDNIQKGGYVHRVETEQNHAQDSSQQVSASNASCSTIDALPPLPLPPHLLATGAGVSSLSGIEKNGITITDINHILARTSSAEFRNSCNDTIRSTSSPATDICERDNDVFSLVGENSECIENEASMEDETTMQGEETEGDEAEDEIVAGTSEEDEIEEIVKTAQAVSESVLIAEEYTEDILAHVKRTELNFLPKWNYMTKQPDITFPMRSILVDWLVEVSEEYKLHTETIFLAVNYIDRFLSYMSVQRARLQLVGTACMFIAAKYEEIYPPDVTEFVYITDDTYTKKQVLRMEQLVLGVLEFNVSVPTAFFFANHFAKMAGCNDKTTSLANYFTELTMLDADTYLPFVPSIIGASAVALARHTLGFAAWDASMIRRTGYTVEDIRMCLIALHQTFGQAHVGAQQAIVEKYKQPKYHGASEVEPTPIF